jgi:hypothetical protein
VEEQVMTDVVAGLRQRFPEFSKGPKRWGEKLWTDEILDAVLQVVIDRTQWSISHPRERVIVLKPLFVQPNLAPQPTGFVPWRPFKNRNPVSNEPGVYLLAYFEGNPEAIVDPLDEHVIDIGKAVDQSTGTRLRQFERSAFGKTGHSAGWTFRLELLQKYYANDVSMLRDFLNIYCSWRDVVDDNPSALETQLICEYRLKWGSRPYLNRKD